MGTYGPRVPASRVGYVPEAQGGLPPGPRVLYVRGTRTSLGRTVRTAYRGTPGEARRAAGNTPCCEGCARTMRALLAGALCFVAGYALAVALHDGQWGPVLCGTLGMGTPKFYNPPNAGSPTLGTSAN